MGFHPCIQTPFPTSIIGSIVLAVLSRCSIYLHLLSESLLLEREVFVQNEKIAQT